MLALRLVAGGAEIVDGPGVAKRLGGASLETAVASPVALESAAAFDALVFVGGASPSESEVERWLLAKKHVLLATEPCLSADALQGLSKVAQEAGVQFAAWNPDRYLPSRRVIQQEIVRSLGEVGLVRMHRWEAAPTAPPADVWKLPRPLVRDIEQVLWFAGKSPDRVFALEQVSGGKSSDSDASCGRSIQVHLGFPSGMALIDYNGRLPAGTEYRALNVIGHSGAAYADDQQNSQLLFRGGPAQTAVTRESATSCLAGMIQDFVDAIADGRDLLASISDWQAVSDVVDAIDRSLKSGKAIALEGTTR